MYEQYYNSLLRFLRQRLPTIEIASDIAQETFVRALETEKNASIANPRALLFRIAGNLCIDYYRKAGNQPHNQMMDIDELDPPAPMEGYPDSQLDKNQKLARLNDALSSLPARCREIFILHKFEGYSHMEIANRFGISRNAVEKNIIKAMLLLRRQLNDSEAQ